MSDDTPEPPPSDETTALGTAGLINAVAVVLPAVALIVIVITAMAVSKHQEVCNEGVGLFETAPCEPLPIVLLGTVALMATLLAWGVLIALASLLRLTVKRHS